MLTPDSVLLREDFLNRSEPLADYLTEAVPEAVPGKYSKFAGSQAPPSLRRSWRAMLMIDRDRLIEWILDYGMLLFEDKWVEPEGMTCYLLSVQAYHEAAAFSNMQQVHIEIEKWVRDDFILLHSESRPGFEKAFATFEQIHGLNTLGEGFDYEIVAYFYDMLKAGRIEAAVQRLNRYMPDGLAEISMGEMLRFIPDA